jgi:Asp/Glu/hydantoin racemase
VSSSAGGAGAASDGQAVRPTVGVIHATLLSIDPILLALDECFPEAQVWNVLDDSLMRELRAAGGITPRLDARMERIVGHLVADGVDAIQFACSSFGPIVERVAARLDIPVRKPDEAMYRELAEESGRVLGIVASIPAALTLAVEQLTDALGPHAAATPLVTRCVPAVLEASEQGEDATALRLIVQGVDELREEGADVIALAQYSLAPFAGRVMATTGADVRTGPHAAARDLRAALATPGGGPVVATDAVGGQ